MMADDKPTEKIVLCKMFTGNYWENENNLGHETINMFLPDGEKKKKFENRRSYIYLPASGDYDLTKHKIKKVVLVRSFLEKGGQTVQILGKADVIEVGGELLRDENGPLISSCSSGSEFEGLMNIFSIFNNGAAPICCSITEADVERKIDEIAAKYDFKIENDDDYRKLAIKLGFKKEGRINWNPKEEMTRRELQNRLKREGKKIPDDETIRSKVKAQNFYRGKKLDNYYFWYAVCEGAISNPKTKNEGYDKKAGFCNLVARKYQKAIELSDLFQSCAQKKVRGAKYAGLEYDTIFKHNAHYGKLNICASLKVQNLKIVPKGKNVFLTINNSKAAKADASNNEKWIYVNPQNLEEDVDGKKNCKGLEKISAQSQKVYLPYNDKEEGLWKKLDGIGNEWWEDAGFLKIKDEDKEYLKDSFLTVIKKEYDELTYSNLFAHFFKRSSQFAQYFFKNILYKRKMDAQKNRSVNSINFSNKLSTESLLISDEDWKKAGGGQVKREEKNIDIVLKDGDQVIVIENKIKSALNGVQIAENQDAEKGSEGEKGKKITFKDQLIRYYQYIEEKYHTDAPENHKYFIFAPDYNPIEEEDFGKTLKGKKMDEVWRIVRYSDIFNCCKDYKYKEDNKFDEFDKKLFEEFLKALNVHTDSSANNYYRQMQKRLMQIKSEKEKNK